MSKEFQSFQPLAGTSTPITRELALRTLSDEEYRLLGYLKKRLPPTEHVPRALKIAEMAYNLHSTYWKIRNAKNGLTKKGLIETWTVTHQNPSRGPGFFTRTTYYRIKR
jgi:hypothetical protein